MQRHEYIYMYQKSYCSIIIKMRQLINIILLMGLLVGCTGFPDIPEILPIQTETIELVETATQASLDEDALELSATATSTDPPTDTPTDTVTATATEVPCDQAELMDYGYQDVSSNSGNIIPGSEFVYTWRIKNIGACVWTTDYKIELVDQQGLKLDNKVPFPKHTLPGQIISISVLITAPKETGDYSATWRLRNANDEVFGFGSAPENKLVIEFSVAPPVVYIKDKPTTALPQEVVELCNLSPTEEKKVNDFLAKNAMSPTMSEVSDDGIENKPGTRLEGQVKIFRVRDTSKNEAAPLYKLLSSHRKTYVSIDSKFLIPDGTEVVFIKIPMDPQLILLQKELKYLISDYNGPTLTNEFPTTLGYYVHAFPIYGRDRCRSLVGAIFHDSDTEVYVDYRFPHQD